MVCHRPGLGRFVGAWAVRGADRWAGHCREPCLARDHDCHQSASEAAQEPGVEKMGLHQKDLRRLRAVRQAARRIVAVEVVRELSAADARQSVAPAWGEEVQARDAARMVLVLLRQAWRSQRLAPAPVLQVEAFAFALAERVWQPEQATAKLQKAGSEAQRAPPVWAERERPPLETLLSALARPVDAPRVQEKEAVKGEQEEQP
jgi:hypothetical protein